VTDRDICMGALFQGLGLSQSRVANVMSKRLVTCSPAADVADIEATLRTEQLRRLPVVGHDGHRIGAVPCPTSSAASSEKSARRSSSSVRFARFERRVHCRPT
jgi:predicted transcriptional regulator